MGSQLLRTMGVAFCGILFDLFEREYFATFEIQVRLVRYEVVRLFAKVAKCGSEFGMLFI